MLQYYDVTMRVEVSRRVLARNESEAREKVDTNDMIYEIKNYGFDEELYVKPNPNMTVDEFDIIQDIGEQIVKCHSYTPLHVLRKMYQQVKDINRKREQRGEPAYFPHIMKNRLTESFLNQIINELGDDYHGKNTNK